MITLSSRISICQSVAEVWLNDVASLEAVSHRFNFTTVLTDLLIYYRASFASDQVPQCESELTAGCVRVLGSAPYCSRSCTNFMFLLYTASSKLENGTSQLFGSAPCFRSFSIMVSVHINLKLHQKNKFSIQKIYNISREKFEPEPGFEPRTSGFLARCSTT